MKIKYRRDFEGVVQVFDLEDRYARERGISGRHPRPLGPVKFYLVDQSATEFRKWPELMMMRNPSGYALFFGVMKYADGVERHLAPQGETYSVRVESRYYQHVERALPFPMSNPRTPIHIDLSPGYAYPFPTTSTLPGLGPTLLRGNVQDAERKGLANVVISVEGQPDVTYLTDSSGQFVLVFPDAQPSGDIVVVFTKGSLHERINATILRGHTSSLPPKIF